MRTIILAMGLVCTSLHASAFQPESENVDHTRHQHPHNSKHETTFDDDRFFTDRESPVEIALPVEEDAFNFVIFGDRTGGPDSGVSILADGVRDVNLLEPDLVLTVGDLIQGYNESPEWMKQMREYRAIMDKLICPWFPVAGNHDTYWRFKGTEQKPENEFDSLYELHFGPLWYSFTHKNNEFIILYTDEGNPETGEKTFHKPESQRMSQEQRDFLQEALQRAKDRDHVFVFLHHPRWLKGGYGDDWDSVHQMLVEAGNVAAVFAGHIHYMRHDGQKDGIEYLSLATTGGHQNGEVPDAGFLHHYHVVTVRKNQIAMAAYPVGEVLDPRDITGELASESRTLSGIIPTLDQPIEFARDGSVRTYIETEIKNPTSYPVDYVLSARSDDSRWYFPTDHHHGHLMPGATKTVGFRVLRAPGEIDDAFRMPELVLAREILTQSFRYEVPARSVIIPIDPHELPAPAQPMHETVLQLKQRGSIDALRIPNESLGLPQGAFTVETWFNAEKYGRRTGLVCKTEGSEYGIFVNDAQPAFSVHLDGGYVTAKASKPILKTSTWHHIAGVYDGQEVRLYVDGQLVAKVSGSGRRDTNELPLYIGADVNRSAAPTSPFTGSIDEARLSTIARYTGESFSPARWLSEDKATLFLYRMEGAIGPWMHDASTNRTHAWIVGDALVVPASN